MEVLPTGARRAAKIPAAMTMPMSSQSNACHRLEALRANALGHRLPSPGCFTLAWFVGMYFLFPHAPLWAMLPIGFIYALMINANVVSCTCTTSFTIPFSARAAEPPLWRRGIRAFFADLLRRGPHATSQGENSDRPGEDGDTVDWISIYRHGY